MCDIIILVAGREAGGLIITQTVLRLEKQICQQQQQEVISSSHAAKRKVTALLGL
jgi:hypothetical protein